MTGRNGSYRRGAGSSPLHTRRYGLAMIAAALAALGGCMAPRTSVDPRGVLNVLAPAGFAAELSAGKWVIDGSARAAARHMTVVHRSGVRALRVASGKDRFIAARRIRASLLTTPYLNWSWNVGRHEGATHPIRLVVGFYGGDRKSGSWGSQPLRWLGSALPPHDRILFISWEKSALRRGNLMPATGGKPARADYTARGGRENTGSWWPETLDLANLYQRAWPEDRLPRVRVMFIGIAAEGGGRAPATSHFSEIRLSR